jgi:uncharacterized peroxidase-related enzyme
VTHHGAGLRKLTGDDALVEALATDFRAAAIDQADLAMLSYAEKLTREPWNMSKEDVRTLRRTGFDDAAILDICQICAYFAFVNRMADGLGIGLEDHLRNS